MITFDLIDSRSLINRIERNVHWDKPKESDLSDSLHSIAFSAQSLLPYELLNIGKFSSSGPDFQSSFDKKPTSGLVKTLVAPTNFMSDSYLAWDLKFTLKAGIYAGAYWEEAISSTDAPFYA